MCASSQNPDRKSARTDAGVSGFPRVELRPPPWGSVLIELLSHQGTKRGGTGWAPFCKTECNTGLRCEAEVDKDRDGRDRCPLLLVWSCLPGRSLVFEWHLKCLFPLSFLSCMVRIRTHFREAALRPRLLQNCGIPSLFQTLGPHCTLMRRPPLFVLTPGSQPGLLPAVEHPGPPSSNQ